MSPKNLWFIKAGLLLDLLLAMNPCILNFPKDQLCKKGKSFMNRDSLILRIDNKFDEMVDFTCELVRIPTVNPPGDV